MSAGDCPGYPWLLGSNSYQNVQTFSLNSCYAYLTPTSSNMYVICNVLTPFDTTSETANRMSCYYQNSQTQCQSSSTLLTYGDWAAMSLTPTNNQMGNCATTSTTTISSSAPSSTSSSTSGSGSSNPASSATIGGAVTASALIFLALPAMISTITVLTLLNGIASGYSTYLLLKDVHTNKKGHSFREEMDTLTFGFPKRRWLQASVAMTTIGVILTIVQIAAYQANIILGIISVVTAIIGITSTVFLLRSIATAAGSTGTGTGSALEVDAQVAGALTGAGSNAYTGGSDVTKVITQDGPHIFQVGGNPTTTQASVSNLQGAAPGMSHMQGAAPGINHMQGAGVGPARLSQTPSIAGSNSNSTLSHQASGTTLTHRHSTLHHNPSVHHAVAQAAKPPSLHGAAAAVAGGCSVAAVVVVVVSVVNLGSTAGGINTDSYAGFSLASGNGGLVNYCEGIGNFTVSVRCCSAVTNAIQTFSDTTCNIGNEGSASSSVDLNCWNNCYNPQSKFGYANQTGVSNDPYFYNIGICGEKCTSGTCSAFYGKVANGCSN